MRLSKFGFLILLIFIILGALVLRHFLFLKSLTIAYDNVHSVKVYKSGDPGSPKTKPAAEIKTSGQVVRLSGGHYVVRYEGDEGYQNGSRSFDLNKNQTVRIQPNYSAQKLASILSVELNSIRLAIAQQYPASSAYDIQAGKLYRNGDWYGTTLVYKGADLYDADSLRIVLHKESGSWKIKTNPPYITLSKYIYVDVPVDILKDVNAQ